MGEDHIRPRLPLLKYKTKNDTVPLPPLFHTEVQLAIAADEFSLVMCILFCS